LPQVGCFDPYSDDPRLGVQKIALCKYTAKMVVAGTAGAGRVLVMELSDEKSEHAVSVATVDLLQDREGFTWKGHDRLSPRNGPLPFAPGFQPSVLVQCVPPAAVTAVTLHSEWNLVAFGTSHGFGLFDYYRRNPVLARYAAHHGPTMWAGTNSGSVFAYALEVPSQEKFSERAVEAVLGKEIQLMHRAPVVAIAVLDGRGNPLPEPYEVSRDLAKAPDMQGSHSMLISSEEQFKVFTLPKVSAKTKFKLTAHEGCRVRKVAPGDISGIASCVFTKHGQGFYLISPSEFERFSLSARNVTEPLCRLE
ncbi:PREDICTED: lethal(2) giant larvae protein homolog 1-like, partial [Phaethon lepturus]|uniref:lethal(2) giant larvae protein homolog 1-like n=1 Tax=Phaethon lepturus TaxID=97097 RepID=UPI000530979A